MPRLCLISPFRCLQVYVLFSCIVFNSSCSTGNQIASQASRYFFTDTAIRHGHTGISIYEPATNRYWYNHDANKYFIPASNTKLFTLYAGMKYLGDSLTGLNIAEYKDALVLIPTGDPTLLHPDFIRQPVFDFLASSKKTLWGNDNSFNVTAYGKGWAWDDYNDSYMPERSALPVYGNLISFKGSKNNIEFYPKTVITQSRFNIYSKNGAVGYIDKVNRKLNQNEFTLNIDGINNKKIQVPFITSADLAFRILADTLHKNIISPNTAPPEIPDAYLKMYRIFSQPSDSLFTPMMHQSNNFFAEQVLLMAGAERLGYMSDKEFIDTLLQTDLHDIPQQPRWVDGSGLSRYNLFTPQSFVYILNKMINEFGLERIKTILPTGNEGTLKNFFMNSRSMIYAKTGSLSNNFAISGILVTDKGRLLLFSVMVNHFNSPVTPVRGAIEQFLENIRKQY